MGLFAWLARPNGTELAEDTFIGLGQRLLATDDGEYPLLQCRIIDFATAIS